MSRRSRRKNKEAKHLANDLEVYGLPPLQNDHNPSARQRGPAEVRSLRKHGDPKYADILAAALEKSGHLERATHGFHSYPAGMHPDCARLIIEALPGHVHDPFCGGGTVLVEAQLQERPCSGNDLSPIATLITLARCSSPSMATPLRSAARKIAKLGQLRTDVEVPELADHWYEQHVAQELGRMRDEIKNSDAQVRPLLQAVFSSILIKSSYRQSDTSNKRNPYHRPPGTTSVLFHKKARELGKMLEQMPERPLPKISLGSACEKAPQEPVDLILTSPPYPGVYDYLPLQQLRLAWLRPGSRPALAKEIGSRRDFRAKGRKNAVQDWQHNTDLWIAKQASALRPEGAMIIVVGDGLVGGKLVDALYPTVQAMEQAGLKIIARASADRPDHARGAIRIEHLVMGQKID